MDRSKKPVLEAKIAAARRAVELARSRGEAEASIDLDVLEVLLDPSSLRSKEQICEQLVRHVEMSGEEVFTRNYIMSDETRCTVWCTIGPHAQEFRDGVQKWLTENGFREVT